MVRFLSTIFVRQYIGEHIRCITGGGIPDHVVNTFCFFTTTFTVVSSNEFSNIYHLFDRAIPSITLKLLLMLLKSIVRCFCDRYAITMKHYCGTAIYHIRVSVQWIQMKMSTIMPTINGSVNNSIENKNKFYRINTFHLNVFYWLVCVIWIIHEQISERT